MSEYVADVSYAIYERSEDGLLKEARIPEGYGYHYTLGSHDTRDAAIKEIAERGRDGWTYVIVEEVRRAYAGGRK